MYTSRGVPAGRGTFRVVPTPRPPPVSAASPVPGYQGDWWRDR